MPHRQGPATLEEIADKVDSTKRIVMPVWGIVVALVLGGAAFGKFYYQYQDAYENGSPAVRLLLEKQNTTIGLQQQSIDKLTRLIENQQALSELQQAETNRRLERLESRAK